MRHSGLTTAVAATLMIAAVSVENGTPTAQCKGNACASVLFEVSGGCFNATNLGGKPIVIEWGGYELKVSPGGSKSVKKDGRCVADVGGPLTATFG